MIKRGKKQDYRKQFNLLPIRKVGDEYSIPKSTLYDHASGKVGLNAKSGQHKHLDTIEE